MQNIFQKSPFYAFLLLLFFSFSMQKANAQQKKNGTMYVLLIAATEENGNNTANNRGIGEFVKTSVVQAENNFTYIADALNMKLEVETIKGYDLTGDNVRTAVKNFSQKKDAVGGKSLGFIMTFTHGANYQNAVSSLPYLLCKPTTNVVNNQHDSDIVSSHGVYDYVRQNGQFDNFHMWVEACNEIPTGWVSPNTNISFSGGGITRMGGSQNLEKLFFSAKSSIMSSSVYSQFSFGGTLNQQGDKGGFFSTGLWAAVAEVEKGTVQPIFEGQGGFFEKTIAFTEQIAITNNENQTPQGFVEDVPKQQPQLANNNNNNSNQGNCNSNQNRGTPNQGNSLQFTNPTNVIGNTYKRTSVENGNTNQKKRKVGSVSGTSFKRN